MAAYAILLAAGRGARFGSENPKQFVQLEGYPIYQYSLRALLSSSQIQGVVTVVSADKYAEIEEELRCMPSNGKPNLLAVGGETRAESCLAGIARLHDSLPVYPEDSVLIHDAARPFLTGEMLDDLLEVMRGEKAATLAIQSTDTLLEVGVDGNVETVPLRSKFWRAQTPQVFQSALLRSAYAAARDFLALDNTDECSLVRRVFPEVRVAVVPGDVRNIKVTHPDDYDIAVQYMRAEGLL